MSLASKGSNPKPEPVYGQIAQLKASAGLEPYRRLLALKPDGDKFEALCPWHNDKNPSLVVYPEARHHCFACEAHGDALDLIQKINGSDLQTSRLLLEDMAGTVRPKLAKTYEYTDQTGELLFAVERYEPKAFRQWKPERGGKLYKLGNVRKPLYKLPEVIEADEVWFVEGEKDADTLCGLGLTATTAAGGANARWLPEYTETLAGKTVKIVPDNDEPGRKGARQVYEAIKDVADAHIVEIPAGHKDASDYVAAGASVTDIKALPASAPSEVRPTETGVSYRKMADIQSRPINWLWNGWIAKGKTTLIAGDPGLGKSQQTLALAASVSCGGTLPDGTKAERGKVIVVSAEDDPADAIRPRLEAAGADLENIFIVDAVKDGLHPDGTAAERGFSLSDDLQRLGKVIEQEGGVSLIVIDPVSAYLGRTDSHKNADVRAILAPLSKLAEQHSAAIVVVSHLNKTTGGNALARVNGSGAFGAAARAAYLVIRDPADDDRRLFLPMKNNIGADQTGMAFTIESVEVTSATGPIQTSRVCWNTEAVTMTATEALQVTAGTPDERSAVADASEWLADLLSDGATPANDVRANAQRAGYSWATVRRAKSSLQVEAVKEGRSGWFWRLESEDAHQGAHVQSLSTFQNLSTFQGEQATENKQDDLKALKVLNDSARGTGDHLQTEVDL